MFKKMMVKAEKTKLKKKTPQDITDALVSSFFDTLYKRLSQVSAPSYLEQLELLTADTIDFKDKKRQLEFAREVKEADRILAEFDEIFAAHVTSFWNYVEKVQEANWPSHKNDVREAWTRWASKAERTLKLVQAKTEVCIENLSDYKTKKYEKMARLKKLRRITSEQLYRAWLNKKNPITGEILD